MKKLFDDFRKFISRGNVLDLAVGVMIGAAFKAIVDSLVGDILSPFIGLIGGEDLSALSFTVAGVAVNYGAFISAIINFIIVAFVLMLIVKAAAKAASFRRPREEAPKEPETKRCPYCMSEIPAKATRCPNCTSELLK